MYSRRVLTKLYGEIAASMAEEPDNHQSAPHNYHILNTPNLVSSIGAFSAAAKAKPTVIRV